MPAFKHLAAVIVALAVPAIANAQAIGGTYEASFAGFSPYGVPSVSLTLTLTCGLSCDAAAPDLHFGIAGQNDGYFAAAPMRETGWVGSGFGAATDKTGSATEENSSFKAGSNVFLIAHSVTCRCGNRTGQGGFIDLKTKTVSIPPWISLPTAAVVGTDVYLLVTASPRGAETVEVHATGAGVELTKLLSESDYPGTTVKSVIVHPTEPGTLTVSAVVGGGTAATKTFEVVSKASKTTPGSSDAGSESKPKAGEPQGGCAAVPSAVPFSVLLLIALSRRPAGASASRRFLKGSC